MWVKCCAKGNDRDWDGVGFDLVTGQHLPPEMQRSCSKKHLFLPLLYPPRYRDKDLKDNYCRNPDNRLRPWCYTMDPKTPWEYCNITICGKEICLLIHVNSNCWAVGFAVCRRKVRPGDKMCVIDDLIRRIRYQIPW